MRAQPEHATAVGEEEHVAVRVRGRRVLDVVLVGGAARTDDALAAPVLRAIRVERHALDVPAVGEGDEDLLLRDEVLLVHLELVVTDLAAARIGEPPAQVGDLVLDDAVDQARVGEELLELRDLLDQLLVLLAELAALEPCQPSQAEVDDRLRLALGEAEALLEGRLRGLLVLRAADDRDRLVEVVEDDDQPFEDMGSVACGLQLVPRAARDHVAPVR